jgi:hypothetical protein
MADQPKQAVEVMLDLYSGRPNPSWTLTEREIEELRSLLDASKVKASEDVQAAPYLGYAGFVITNRGGVKRLPYRINVNGGVLSVTEKKPAAAATEKAKKEYRNEASKPVRYLDGHGIESWLLVQAEKHGYAEAIAAMGGPRLGRRER